jgi:hypothetical protein
VLENHPNFRPRLAQVLGLHGEDVLAVNDDLPGCGPLKTVNHPDEGTLPGAGIPDYAVDVPPLDI